MLKFDEHWKPLEGFEGIYEISSWGHIKSCKSGKVRKPSVNSSGENQIVLLKHKKVKNFLISKLVAESFIGPSDGRVVLFKDNDKFNTKVSNLYYSNFKNESEIEGETWKPIVGYEGLYEVSDKGRVRSLPGRTSSGKILSVGIGNRGRRLVVLSKKNKTKNFTVASLVLAAFKGPCPEGMICRHWNDSLDDDSIENLKYGTHQDNEDDKVRNGHSLKGEKHHKAKLTEPQVKEIKARLKQGETCVSLAKEFEVKSVTVEAINQGRNWGWLE